jgi:hypothetical protein
VSHTDFCCFLGGAWVVRLTGSVTAGSGRVVKEGATVRNEKGRRDGQQSFTRGGRLATTDMRGPRRLLRTYPVLPDDSYFRPQ